MGGEEGGFELVGLNWIRARKVQVRPGQVRSMKTPVQSVEKQSQQTHDSIQCGFETDICCFFPKQGWLGRSSSGKSAPALTRFGGRNRTV